MSKLPKLLVDCEQFSRPNKEGYYIKVKPGFRFIIAFLWKRKVIIRFKNIDKIKFDVFIKEKIQWFKSQHI